MVLQTIPQYFFDGNPHADMCVFGGFRSSCITNVSNQFGEMFQYEVAANVPTSPPQLTLSGVACASVLGYVTVLECSCR